MTRRVRVIRYHVQPEIVVDDGDTLEPLPVQPITVSASQWAAFVEHGLAQALSELEAQQNPELSDDGDQGK